MDIIETVARVRLERMAVWLFQGVSIGMLLYGHDGVLVILAIIVSLQFHLMDRLEKIIATLAELEQP